MSANTEHRKQVVLLGSSLRAKGQRELVALDEDAIAALASGSAESLNPKVWVCEDSVALHRLPDRSLLAAVADAHYGGFAGEAVLDGLVDDFLTSRAPSVCERLTDALRAADERLHAQRPRDDRSETTALVVHVSGRTLSWVSIGDSYLLVGRSPLRVVNEASFAAWPRYVGAQALSMIAPSGPAFDHGQTMLRPGDVVLLATDGIETRSSGIALANASAIINGPNSLEDRLSMLQALCDHAPSGGGRDNLGMVAIAIR